MISLALGRNYTLQAVESVNGLRLRLAIVLIRKRNKRGADILSKGCLPITIMSYL